jgi:hypothetical protein
MAHPQAMAVRKSGIRRFMPRRASLDENIPFNYDAFSKTQRMAKQKVRVVFQGRKHTSVCRGPEKTP